MDGSHGGYPVEAGYMVCMMSQQGYADGNHVLVPGSQLPGAAHSVLPSEVPPGEWGAAKASAGFGGKAMTIRNPETGEIIGSKPKAEDASRSAKDVKKLQSTTKREVLTRRMRAARWCADHSTFSALNIEGLPRALTGSPFAGSPGTESTTTRGKGLFAVSSAATSMPRVIPVPAPASMLKSELTKKGTSEKITEEDDADEVKEKAAQEEHELSEEAEDTLSSLERSSSTKKPWKPKFMKGSSSLDRGSDEEQPRQTSSASTALPEDVGAESAAESEESPENSRTAEAWRRSATEPAGETSNKASRIQQDRAFLLAYRTIVSEVAPESIADFVAKEVEGFAKVTTLEPIPADRPAPTPKGEETPSDRLLFGLHRKVSQRDLRTPKSSKSGPLDPLLTPSDKAYRTPKSKDGAFGIIPRDQELKRLVQSFLNKICPENVSTIVEKLAQIQVNDASELELLISLIFKKALAEPHYCETYADLVFSLKSSFTEFPPCEDGGKPITFKSLLLNICQSEFESLPTILDPTEEDAGITDPEEIEFRRKQRKNRVLANMKFIGHLFLRQLLSAKVIGSVIQELVLCDNEDKVPEEHVIECTLELLLNIGYTLETIPFGAQSLTQVCGRLMDLKNRKRSSGQGVYSKRIQFAIQDLLETRAAGWAKKLFRETAKTKEEIRLEQKRDEAAAACGKEAKKAEHVVAGMRPQYIEERKASRS
eukprot:CAMPEP_0178436200 /NCGR_PEP_ID=MMETSP0689_2-20121128/34318_1 /TAXON_ID=160604 /ORGANISM="Amphidinium massartii, Strain CS-259" /LENGTH=710 /DNA_ID=CAMNT_0020058291 /DNA_START=50 /DNA_END=2182 /DNA_ORIENTATION=-